MNIFTKVAVTGLALSLSSFASAAISGSTDFRVTLPEVLVLYHWDDAVLNLTEITTTTAANDSDAREISDATTRTGTAVLGAATATINTDVNTTSNTALATNVAVTLKNAWAVRNLSSANGVSLTLTNPNTSLKNVVNNASVITTSNAVLVSANPLITTSGTTTVGIKSGFVPVLGDITFNLDLSTANNAGEYNTRGVTGASPDTVTGNGTDTFLLTLTGNGPTP